MVLQPLGEVKLMPVKESKTRPERLDLASGRLLHQEQL
jgi:hypothetical protein